MIGFGTYTTRETTPRIHSLKDKRLVKIDPNEPEFFLIVDSFAANNDIYWKFKDAVNEAREAKIEPFYKPIIDPSFDAPDADDYGENVVFEGGRAPAEGKSYNWWLKAVKTMPKVERREWKIGNEYQYYIFLVWLINQLVKSGKCYSKAMIDVVSNSRDIGNYIDSKSLRYARYREEYIRPLEPTGSRGVAGGVIYDIGNTIKYLQCSNPNAEGFWFAGGGHANKGEQRPAASLEFCAILNRGFSACVPMLIL